ncbi:aldose 1-epimerase family protein [Heterostelium album PN500]|uniref:glucose-6-phosphate 1-epimerase n=1 Tax=Heterostelium pallidum (strain ATCC 26659 / Pp 5 / PN500) TaxID=670386 RepID=D3BA93_HETP5|nr:aldose 1-epimerase family protein [Heterostelium album PN500]EFA81480.1 aldose 1-epimerase family protein [Heterostelium album PN500]|eukprot:XP_020433598.1 aldose 1-epimerase family protein [Heterostelium album PN500]
MSLEQLQKEWNRDGVTVCEDKNLIQVRLETPTSSCSIYLNGAHVSSFIVNGVQQFFLSEKSAYEPKKAIRGGIPLIYPQFGPGNIQTHGFARNMQWSIKSTFSEGNGTIGIKFELKDDDYSRNIWPNSFRALYSVILHPAHLELRFSNKNTDIKPWNYQLAFHTYYSISNIQNVHVEGLSQYEFIDKMKKAQKFTESRQNVTIQEEVDRVYVSIKPDTPIVLVDQSNQHKIILKSENLNDAVVWNPWVDKSKAMADFGDLEYPNMICIEAGQIEKPKLLSPGEKQCHKHFIFPSSKQSPSL